MSENVLHAIGPVLQKIQERLSSIEAKLDRHDRRFDGLAESLVDIDKRLAKQNVQVMHALGLTTDANLQTVMVSEDVERLGRQLETLTQRVDILERSDA